MITRLLLSLALGAALIACTPTNSGTAAPSVAVPTDAMPSDAMPSDAMPSDAMPSDSASPAAS